MKDTARRIRNGITDPLDYADEEIVIFDRFEKKSGPADRDIEKPESQLLGYLPKISGLLSPIAGLQWPGVGQAGQSAKQNEDHKQASPTKRRENLAWFHKQKNTTGLELISQENEETRWKIRQDKKTGPQGQRPTNQPLSPESLESVLS